jgi:hypothetical protein
MASNKYGAEVASAIDAGAAAQLLTGYSSTTGVVAASDTIVQGISKLNGNMAAGVTNAAITAKVITGFVSGAGVVAATDTILQAINKLDGNQIASAGVASAALPSASFTDAAVTSKLITGFVSGAGVVAAGDTILQALNKIDGNEIAGHALATAALPSASFTDAAVTGKLITGFVSGAGVVAAADTILQAINKLDGNVAGKADYSEPAVSLTLDHGIGATACVCRKVGKVVTLEIPALSDDDGLGTVISSGVGDIDAALRPAADIWFPVRVNDNAGSIQMGMIKIDNAGTLTIGATPANVGFTNAAACGVFRIAISWTVA